MSGNDEPSSEADFRRVFCALATPAVVTDLSFRIREVTDACTSITGYDRDAMCGEAPIGLFADPERYVTVTESLETGDAWQGDVELLTRRDRRVPTRCIARKVAPLDAYVITFRNRMRQRQYEQGIRVFDRVLRHNLRNDANVVLGHLENALDRTDGDAHDSVRAALSGVERLLRRGETARTFSDVFADAKPTPLGPIRLDRAAERALSRARTGTATVARDLEPVDVLANDTLPAAVRALVENAIEHNDSADPRVELTVETNGDEAALRVADNGPGIAPSRRDHAFARKEADPTDHGEGLSLFFVDRLMELYGGEARVRSRDDGGAVFELSFRRANETCDR